MQTLLRCPYSPRVQSQASTSASTLKIPNTDGHTPLPGHTKIRHTLIGTGSAALGASVLYPGISDPNIQQRTMKY